MFRPSVILQQTVFILLLITRKISAKAKDDIQCVTIPPNPAHGTLKLGGEVILRMVCTDEGMDISGNAPGNGGVLYCYPNKGNRDLESIKFPQCFKMRTANSVFLTIEAFYEIGACSDDIMDYSTRVGSMHTNIGNIVKGNCAPFVCMMSGPFINCLYTNNNHYIRVLLDSVIVYDQTKPVSVYHRVYDQIVNALKESSSKDWAVTGVSLTRREYKPWKSNCNMNEIGTELLLHQTASCRICEPGSYADTMSRNSRCLYCPFGFYTKKAGSEFKDCELCPHGLAWATRSEMIKLCFNRQ